MQLNDFVGILAEENEVDRLLMGTRSPSPEPIEKTGPLDSFEGSRFQATGSGEFQPSNAEPFSLTSYDSSSTAATLSPIVTDKSSTSKAKTGYSSNVVTDHPLRLGVSAMSQSTQVEPSTPLYPYIPKYNMAINETASLGDNQSSWNTGGTIGIVALQGTQIPSFCGEHVNMNDRLTPRTSLSVDVPRSSPESDTVDNRIWNASSIYVPLSAVDVVSEPPVAHGSPLSLPQLTIHAAEAESTDVTFIPGATGQELDAGGLQSIRDGFSLGGEQQAGQSSVGDYVEKSTNGLFIQRPRKRNIEETGILPDTPLQEKRLKIEHRPTSQTWTEASFLNTPDDISSQPSFSMSYLEDEHSHARNSTAPPLMSITEQGDSSSNLGASMAGPSVAEISNSSNDSTSVGSEAIRVTSHSSLAGALRVTEYTLSLADAEDSRTGEIVFPSNSNRDHYFSPAVNNLSSVHGVDGLSWNGMTAPFIDTSLSTVGAISIPPAPDTIRTRFSQFGENVHPYFTLADDSTSAAELPSLPPVTAPGAKAGQSSQITIPRATRQGSSSGNNEGPFLGTHRFPFIGGEQHFKTTNIDVENSVQMKSGRDNIAEAEVSHSISPQERQLQVEYTQVSPSQNWRQTSCSNSFEAVVSQPKFNSTKQDGLSQNCNARSTMNMNGGEVNPFLLGASVADTANGYITMAELSPSKSTAIRVMDHSPFLDANHTGCTSQTSHARASALPFSSTDNPFRLAVFASSGNTMYPLPILNDSDGITSNETNPSMEVPLSVVGAGILPSSDTMHTQSTVLRQDPRSSVSHRNWSALADKVSSSLQFPAAGRSYQNSSAVMPYDVSLGSSGRNTPGQLLGSYSHKDSDQIHEAGYAKYPTRKPTGISPLQVNRNIAEAGLMPNSSTQEKRSDFGQASQTYRPQFAYLSSPVMTPLSDSLNISHSPALPLHRAIYESTSTDAAYSEPSATAYNTAGFNSLTKAPLLSTATHGESSRISNYLSSKNDPIPHESSSESPAIDHSTKSTLLSDTSDHADIDTTLPEEAPSLLDESRRMEIPENRVHSTTGVSRLKLRIAPMKRKRELARDLISPYPTSSNGRSTGGSNVMWRSKSTGFNDDSEDDSDDGDLQNLNSIDVTHSMRANRAQNLERYSTHVDRAVQAVDSIAVDMEEMDLGRSESKLQLECAIHAYAVKLLEYDSEDERSKLKTVTNEQLEKLNRGLCHPTKEDFVLDLQGSVRNKWNMAATCVFADAFLESGRSPSTDRIEIENSFNTYIKTLQRHFKHQENMHDPVYVDRRNRELENDAKRRRRNNLLQSRLRGAKRHADTVRFVPLLKKLGVDGMSDDEEVYNSGGNDGKSQYLIVRSTWRNPELDKWLHIFDLLDLSGKWQPNGIAKRGRFMRTRRESGRMVQGTSVRALPINWYCQKFRDGLSTYEAHILNMQPAVSIQHTDAVEQFAMRYHNCNRQTGPPATRRS